ncbi:unnamed protein product [Cyprideis torosa]|uniref:Cysteine-rich PDZ-binding protein n=1 Tax=Cyprideis torosa TaxID=163714 RepID=A0A7R8W3T2_9CRUS|nr:unnamed protein product [Cyprideis torosa]CAG0881222.1 unnamed protein product [Cyprideis torosa]
MNRIYTTPTIDCEYRGLKLKRLNSCVKFVCGSEETGVGILGDKETMSSCFYFNAMFGGEFSEGDSSAVSLPWLEQPELAVFLFHAMHSCRLSSREKMCPVLAQLFDERPSSVPELMEIADFLGFEELALDLKKHIRNMLDRSDQLLTVFHATQGTDMEEGTMVEMCKIVLTSDMNTCYRASQVLHDAIEKDPAIIHSIANQLVERVVMLRFIGGHLIARANLLTVNPLVPTVAPVRTLLRDKWPVPKEVQRRKKSWEKLIAKPTGRVILMPGARNTTEGGGRKVGENKALTASKNRFSPYSQAFAKCRICGQKVHQSGSHYCQGCAYKKGIFLPEMIPYPTTPLQEALSIFFVALIWGFTNPLMNLASNQTYPEKMKRPGSIQYVIYWLLSSATSLGIPAVPLVFAFNQLGSAVFLYLLGSGDLSYLIPVTNALTLVFTLLWGWWLGERKPQTGTIQGI